MLRIFLLFCFLLHHCCGQAEVEDSCTTQDQPGTCKLVYQCEAAIKSIRTDGFHKLKRCGFRGMSEIVCCMEGKEEDTYGDRFAQDDLLQPQETTQKPQSTTPGRIRAPSRLPATIPMIQTRRPPTEQEIRKSTTTTTEKPTTQKPKRRVELECDKIVNAFDPPLDSYILNGVEVAPGDFPYMAAIGYLSKSDEEDPGLKFLCGGSLVSDRFVLTAAHCIHRPKLRGQLPSVVKLGIVNLKANVTEYKIEETIVHPEFASRTIANDIGLVKLADRVQFTDTLHPACLFTKQEIPARLPLIVIGFGVTNFKTREFSSALLKASLRLVSNEECQPHYSSSRNQQIRDNMLCAGDKNGGKDACQGDSGGPLQALTENDGHYRVLGITSFGKLCGTESPGVYTRVSSYLDWIESTVWVEPYDKRNASLSTIR